MDIQAYFDRIGYSGPFTATPRTLRELHRLHMSKIPFENLDIGTGREIILDTDRFIDKIVKRRRGGFCYELNGAFARLLAAMGFHVSLLSARVADKKEVLNEEFDHLTLHVEPARGRSGEAWLVDVGFGDSFLEPLRFVGQVEQHDPAGVFRLVNVGDRWRLERRDREAAWRLQYDFSLKPRRLSEFAGMCRYHQTSRESHFTRNRICSIATERGRTTLSGMRLIVTSNGTRDERKLENDLEVWEALRHHFGVVVDEQHPIGNPAVEAADRASAPLGVADYDDGCRGAL